MLSISVHSTQRDAVKRATESAKEYARDTGKKGEARVLLVNGDTLDISATPGGRVTRKVSRGWIISGYVNISKKIEPMVY